MAKTAKILDFCENGMRLVCIKHMDGRTNPYSVYQMWWDMGWHRKLITKYADATSVMYRAAEIVYNREHC